MNELDKTKEAILIECLQALEGGADLADCLARYPQHADALRPYLELRAEILSLEMPQPTAASYEAGRQALLERAVSAHAEEGKRLGRPWLLLPKSVRSLAGLAAVSFVLLLLAGGALGASAAGGFDPARDVLSALHIVGQQSQGDGVQSQNADEGADNAGDGIANAPTAAAPGREQASDRALEGSDNANVDAPEVVPGIGLCFAESALQHPPDLPDEVLERIPDEGLCIPEGVLQHAPDGRPCVPESAVEHLPDVLGQLLDSESTCDSDGAD